MCLKINGRKDPIYNRNRSDNTYKLSRCTKFVKDTKL